MNREQFIGFMEAPGSLKGDSLILLEGLLKEFPYCQTARMLYLKTLHNQKSIHYNSQLKVTAAYAGNRKNLYQLILQHDLISKISQLEAEVIKKEKKPEIKEKPPITIPKPALIKPETIKEKPSVTIPKPAIQNKSLEKITEKPEENKPARNTIDPNKVESKPETAVEKPPVTIQKPPIQIKPLEKITENPVENKLKQNIVGTEKPEAKPETAIEKAPVAIPKPIIQNESLEKVTEKPEENQVVQNTVELEKKDAKPETVIEKHPVTIPNPAMTEAIPSEKAEMDASHRDFDDNIAELEQEILNEAISAAIQSEELQSVIPIGLDNHEPTENEQNQQSAAVDKTGKHSFSEWLKLVDKNKIQEKEKSIKSKEEKVKFNELVERFISEEPKIRPKRTEFFSPANMARLSMIEDWSFVTETLAKVYAKQGNYIKAIRAYENLILKYPEKNAYFAAQIHSLKELKEKNSK